MKATQLSRRKYLVTGIENKETVKKEYNLTELLQDDCLEITYTLQGEVDMILDMKEGQTKYIPISRDNPNDLGVICRIS